MRGLQTFIILLSLPTSFPNNRLSTAINKRRLVQKGTETRNTWGREIAAARLKRIDYKEAQG